MSAQCRHIVRPSAYSCATRTLTFETKNCPSVKLVHPSKAAGGLNKMQFNKDARDARMVENNLVLDTGSRAIKLKSKLWSRYQKSKISIASCGQTTFEWLASCRSRSDAAIVPNSYVLLLLTISLLTIGRRVSKGRGEPGAQ